MLHDLKTLIGQRVTATDGDIGAVRNFLFDDQTWTIRHLAVDVRSWLNRRDVVLPITAVEQPDWVNKTVHVKLTKEQVRNSPDVDTEKPVSRQQETAMMEYWGKLAYWCIVSCLPWLPEPNTPYIPKGICTSEAFGISRVTKSVRRTVNSGGWRVSFWMRPHGTSATWT